MNNRKIADDCLAGNHDDYTVAEVIGVLVAADDLYYNDGESFLSDAEYDAIRMLAYFLGAAHKYFTGIGSEVRGGKVKLPFEMGSLDQVEIGDIQEWVRKNRLENEDLVITDKMDGTSSMAIYDGKGKPQIAYSRGNGVEGADITRHIFKIPNVPTSLACGHAATIRAEVELTRKAFASLKTKVTRHGGGTYKNARNMVAGRMNSKTNPKIVYDNLNVIAYEVIGFEGSKLEQLQFLADNGFQVVEYSVHKGSKLTDKFLAELLNKRRNVLDYEIDGLVIDVNSAKKRAEMNPTRNTLNPAYSIKYKVADESNMALATVTKVEWNISKHGYLNPRVHIQPIELVGVTVTHATGFHAKFIKDNGIGPGAQIYVTRSGDVIPFIVSVHKSVIPQMPTEECSWNETKVNLVVTDLHNHADAKFGQAVDFFDTLEVAHLGDGNLQKFFDAGYNTIESIIKMTLGQMIQVVGANGTKIYTSLRSKLGAIQLSTFAGATPFFGRGVGVRKFTKLISGLRIHSIDEFPLISKSQIESVDGFEAKTALKIVQGVGPFMKFYDSVADYVTFVEAEKATGSSMKGQKVVFTGFRDKDLDKAVIAAGGEMQSGVSSKTTILVAKDANSGSGKLQAARDKGVKVVSIDQLKAMLK